MNDTTTSKTSDKEKKKKRNSKAAKANKLRGLGRAGADPNEAAEPKTKAQLSAAAAQCRLSGTYYPEGSTILYGGQNWTCSGGQWVKS